MIYAIVGSRSIINYNEKIINYIHSNYHNDITEIVSGGAIGIDKIAEEYAIKYNIPIKIIKPDWNIHGRKAGFLRNIEIIKYCDIVLAFWKAKSNGTKHDIDLAIKYNKKIVVIDYDDKSIIKYNF